MMVVHNYYARVLGFPEDIRQPELPIVDDATTIRADNNDEIIIRKNQALYKPYEYVLLMSTFQVM